MIVTENMLGDILSDLTGELAGSLGSAPSLNASATTAMAQAAHGAAPDLAGRGLANPLAMIRSTAMLLRWLAGRRDDPAIGAAADRIDAAVAAAVAGGTVTPDLGGRAGTAAVGRAVVAAIADPSPVAP